MTFDKKNGEMETSLSKKLSADSLADTESMSTVKRQTWGGQLDFIMSCVSYAVGLGNIWRFPYLCYRNGGAVFLIPYLFFMMVCGMPLFFLEVSYGQFASLSPITVWNISPLFKGIGYGMVIISGIVCIYYNIIIAWTFYYLFMSFNSELPWASCNNWWNTPACAVSSDYIANNTVLNTTEATNALNYTLAIKRKSPSEEFWENNVLQISDGIEDMGGIRWELLGCLVLAWVVVFLILIKGVRSSGRVMYFTATFPYLVLTCLLVRGVTLPGALDGIKFYVFPRWEKLLSLRIWGEAAMQIFYSIGAAWGALVTLGSFNKFKNNCYRDCLILPLLNCGTSIFAGFVIFSIIGFMAYETGSTIDEVITQGPGLVFVVYPEAVSKFPVAPLWAIMFFLMLLSIGVGSQVAMFQTVTNAFVDEFSFLKNKKLLLTAILCVTEFLLGIPCVTRGGIYYLQIMDWYSSTFSLMILSIIELLVFSWIYGVGRFYKDIELMIGFQPCNLWKILWAGVTPAVIIFVLGFNMVMHQAVTYGTYTYPGWAIGIGWVYALCSIVPLPVVAIVTLLGASGSLRDRVKKTSHHSPEWGPALAEDRAAYYESLRLEGKTTPEEMEVMQRLRPAHKLGKEEFFVNV